MEITKRDHLYIEYLLMHANSRYTVLFRYCHNKQSCLCEKATLGVTRSRFYFPLGVFDGQEQPSTFWVIKKTAVNNFMNVTQEQKK